MNIVEAIYASGRLLYLILVPVFREISAAFLAAAISKDCKARRNGSSVLWGLFTLISPLLSGIIYFIYSRLLKKRDADTIENEKRIKCSRKLTITAILIYMLSLILAVVAVVTSFASELTIISNEEIKGNSLFASADEYYDINGVPYENGEDVILYDNNENSYHYAKSEDGFNYYTYFDENGNEYNIEYCYISSDGYFYYDDKNSLISSDDVWYYDKHFYDVNGNEYAHIDNYVFWDQNGEICIQYSGNKCRYAFK